MKWFLKRLLDFLRENPRGYKAIITRPDQYRKFWLFIKYRHTYRHRIGLFISIPKNASQSTRAILELGTRETSLFKNQLVIDKNHATAANQSRQYDLNNLFVFCFSRNPYTRSVSWYKYHKKVGRPLYNSITFEEWVNKGMPDEWGARGGILSGPADGSPQNFRDRSPLLQYNFVEGGKVDFIGKLENFRPDMMIVIDRLNELCKKKGVHFRFKFSDIRANSSIKPDFDYDSYYNKNTKATVYSLLKKDFEYFGYDK